MQINIEYWRWNKDGQTRINGVVLYITPRVLATAVHAEISMMNWGYGNPTEITRKREVLSTVRSIYHGLRTHLAVSGEGCVPREELQQAGHGVQVLLALPALPRLATRVWVGTVL